MPRLSIGNCKSVTSIRISSSIPVIDDPSFFQGPFLKSISVDSDNTQFGSLENILFTKNFGDSAFSNCYNLQSITIQTSVTSIGHSAFPWLNSSFHLHTKTFPIRTTIL